MQWAQGRMKHAMLTNVCNCVYQRVKKKGNKFIQRQLITLIHVWIHVDDMHVMYLSIRMLKH